MKDKVLYIIYADNGMGYNEEILNKIDELTTFGLSIIKGLIEQLNGTIYFYNNERSCAQIKINKEG